MTAAVAPGNAATWLKRALSERCCQLVCYRAQLPVRPECLRCRSPPLPPRRLLVRCFRLNASLRLSATAKLRSLTTKLAIPLLDRCFLKEAAGPFLLAVGAIAGLGVSLGALVQLAREVVVSGLPLRVALGAALLQTPRFFTLALPYSAMAAVLFADGELGALAAAGVSPARLMVPVCVVGVLAAGMAWGCSEWLVPDASMRARKLVESALTTELHSMQPRPDFMYSEYHARARVAVPADLQRV
eukprot:jgi/Chlat1/3741/Chrsp259S03887